MRCRAGASSGSGAPTTPAISRCSPATIHASRPTHDLTGDLILSPLRLNGAGRLLFTTHEGRLIAGPIGALATLVEPHDPAPGIPDSDLWIRPSLATGNSEVGFDERGEAAYPGWLLLAGSDSYVNVIVGPDATGAAEIRCDDSTPLPDTPEGSASSSLGGDPILNDARDLVFAADYQYPAEAFGWPYMADGRGYWIQDPSGAVHLVAAAGMHLPGFPASSVVSDLGQPELNAAGQVAAFARVRDTDEQGFWTYDSALVYGDRGGRRGILLRAGDTVVVAPGDSRTVARFDSSDEGGIHFPTLDLDDRGRALFTAHFTDGSSALLLASIPRRACGLGLEPLLAVALVAAARRRQSTSR